MLKRVLGPLGVLSFTGLTALLVGCPAPPPEPVTPVTSAVPAMPGLAPANPVPPKLPVLMTAAPSEGKACSSKSDCAANEQCAFKPGCGPGTCMPQTPCTMDLVPYCGCDGQVFKTSGTCPGRPYRNRGGCTDAATNAPSPPIPGSKKACQSNADCGQGESCQGNPGCGAPWTCGPAGACTMDSVEYCSCDNQTFKSSGTCPGRPIKHKGKC